MPDLTETVFHVTIDAARHIVTILTRGGLLRSGAPVDPSSAATRYSKVTRLSAILAGAAAKVTWTDLLALGREDHFYFPR